MKTIPERLSALEVEVKQLQTTMQDVDTKLDDLLALRHKGMGAFWLATSLLGTSLMGILGHLFGWFKL